MFPTFPFPSLSWTILSVSVLLLTKEPSDLISAFPFPIPKPAYLPGDSQILWCFGWHMPAYPGRKVNHVTFTWRSMKRQWRHYIVQTLVQLIALSRFLKSGCEPGGQTIIHTSITKITLACVHARIHVRESAHPRTQAQIHANQSYCTDENI